MFIQNYAKQYQFLLRFLEPLAVKGLVRLEGLSRDNDTFTFVHIDAGYNHTPLLFRFKLGGKVSGIVKGTHYFLNIATGEIKHVSERPQRFTDSGTPDIPPVPRRLMERAKEIMVQNRQKAVMPLRPVERQEERSQPIPTPTPNAHSNDTTAKASRGKIERNEIIRREVAQGLSASVIAARHNITAARVAQIAPVRVYGPKKTKPQGYDYGYRNRDS